MTKFQVNTMTKKETELQREIHRMVQKATELKEELSGEKNRLTEELKVLSEELKSSKVSFSVTDSLCSNNLVSTLSLMVFLRPSVMYQTFFFSFFWWWFWGWNSVLHMC